PPTMVSSGARSSSGNVGSIPVRRWTPSGSARAGSGGALQPTVSNTNKLMLRMARIVAPVVPSERDVDDVAKIAAGDGAALEAFRERVQRESNLRLDS